MYVLHRNCIYILNDLAICVYIYVYLYVCIIHLNITCLKINVYRILKILFSIYKIINVGLLILLNIWLLVFQTATPEKVFLANLIANACYLIFFYSFCFNNVFFFCCNLTTKICTLHFWGLFDFFN